MNFLITTLIQYSKPQAEQNHAAFSLLCGMPILKQVRMSAAVDTSDVQSRYLQLTKY